MHQYLISSDDDFQCNQYDDYLLQAQRTLRINYVGQRLCGVRNYGKFSSQKVRAFLQFVFVFEPSVKSLKIRPFPKNVRFFRHSHKTRNTMLNEQCISDVL